MSLQAQFKGLVGSVASGISSIAQEVSPEAIEETQARLEKNKLARLQQKASMEKQRALYQQNKLKKITAQEKIKAFNSDNNNISIGGETIKDPALIKKLKERING